MGRDRRSVYVRVTLDDIASGKMTTCANPLCRAVRRAGCKGARLDEYAPFIHLYQHRRWYLSVLPSRACDWLERYASGEKVSPIRFYLEVE